MYLKELPRAFLLLCCVLVFNLAQADEESLTATSGLILSEAEQSMLSWIEGQQDKILADLKQQVEINTGTANIEGLNQYRGLLAKELQALGFKTQNHSSSAIDILSCAGGKIEFTDHLVASKTTDKQGKPKLLLNGHMDTVFSVNDEFQKLIIEEDGTLKGPGVADMKGGIVVMLYALKALQQAGRLDDVNLTVLLNSDEEIGSLGSRALIEQLAKEHDLGLVFEGSYQNKVTRSRKGLGQARLKVTGRESHAGGAHEKGVSANLELAHKVIAIEKLTDYQRKITVNTGVMRGGEKRNTIPGCADAYIDLRYPSLKEGEYLQDSLAKIADKKVLANPEFKDLPTIELWSTLHRPVKESNPKVDELLQLSMGLSELIGEPIVGTRYSGGGTDGSIMQAVGLPTLDSLGVDGNGAHSSREESRVSTLYARTKLAAVLLSRLLDSEAD